MPEFWESSFAEKQAMWGFEPTHSAQIAKDIFLQHKVKQVLIPGIGYGRNAKPFADKGMDVTGIEISRTAIGIAKEHYGTAMRIHEGSVFDMPFDDKHYGGIFSFALIHLLDGNARKKLIADCYRQLLPGGQMLIVTIAKSDSRFGSGTLLAEDWYETHPGVRLYFYDTNSIERDFKAFGLLRSFEVDEPVTHMPGMPPMKFVAIHCQKQA